MKNILLLTVLFTARLCISQTAVNTGQPAPHKSIHQEQSEKYAQYNLTAESQWDSLNAVENGSPITSVTRNKRSCNLTKRVYGWQPYWNAGSSTYNNYDWSGLTDLCYFSYDVNSSTGAATSTHGWATATVVTAAQANGVNVSLCAALFSGHTTFFSSSSAQQTLITNLINLVQSRNAHGVNIDFEGMGSSNKAGFTAFMINLCNQMHAAIPGSEVSIALYSVDWGGVFDMAALNPYVDLFIIMGYDYYYSGSSTAGPGDPLYNFNPPNYNYTLTKSITYYLNKGASKSKLLLGLPYYGREWATTLSTIPSSTTGGGTNTVLYNTMRNNTNGYYSSRKWDGTSFSTWFPSVRSGVNWQAFVDDSYSMSKRFDIVNQFGIGGMGIWALGYDNGYNDFWSLIQNKFTSCAFVPCSDTIYDMGGPNTNYYDNERYTYTIAPTGASGLTLNFTSFATEANYDSLWIYNGSSTASPLIGAYTGSASPGIITAAGNALTIRVKSDGATTAAGWRAVWNCSIITDNTAPTTLITAPAGWVTASTFNANFTDADNSSGSGVANSYYQVLDYNGTEWRANNANGFFNDNFDLAVHPDWTSMSGTWGISSAYLEQSDETNSNTNIYAPFTQNISNQYLYNWQGKISGTGTNRRAGFHFFCDDGTQSNRGNSYFIWIRPDQSTIEIYKVTNNVFALVQSGSLTTAVNTWNDYKIIYDPATGKMNVYVNNAFVIGWTDPSPLTNGNAISLRSGNCDYFVNDLKVYRSRGAAVTVSAGAAASNDVRYQNPDPLTPSCRIKSIVKDSAGNLSSAVSQNVNIDWTIPSAAIVSDGTAADIDTTYSLTQLSANWTSCTDTNSGIVKYWYALGTAAGSADVVSWTADSLNTSVTVNGLSLTLNKFYYFSIKSEDGAGLFSNAASSDGQYVTAIVSGAAELTNNLNVLLFPNPFSETAAVEYTLQNNSSVEIILTDVLGRSISILSKISQSAGKHSHLINKSELNIAAGIYTLTMRINGIANNYKLIAN